MDQRQRRALQVKQTKRNAAVLLVVMTVVVVSAGLIIHTNRIKSGADGETFKSGSSETTKEEMLASFAEFGTETIVYYDVQTTQSPVSVTGDLSDLPLTGTTAATTGSGATKSGSGTTLHDYQTGENYAYAYAGFTPEYANLNISDWRLLLVNRDYMLPQDYEPQEGLSEAVKGSGVRLDARVAPYYQQMYDAALTDGITLTPVSGHRRISRQKTNFENKIQYYMNQGYDKVTATQKAAEIILPPGTSEHNAGLCMDIISLDTTFENTKSFAWLQKNAETYGFILRYPKGKENVTKITYEPWHWRFVGVENAKKINASGKCLEEYLGVVR